MKREKKSETLEVRLPHSKKKAFMRACEENGSTASDAVRDFIDAYISRSGRVSLKTLIKEMTMKMTRNPRKITGILAAATTGAVAFGTMPSAADPAVFELLDRDGNGVLTEGEIAPGHDAKIIEVLDKDGSGDVSPDEFETTTTVTKIGDSTTMRDGAEVRIVKAEKTTVMLKDGESSVSVYSSSEDVDVDADSDEVRVIIKRLKKELDEASQD